MDELELDVDEREEKDRPPILPPEAAHAELGSYISNKPTNTAVIAGFFRARKALETASRTNPTGSGPFSLIPSSEFGEFGVLASHLRFNLEGLWDLGLATGLVSGGRETNRTGHGRKRGVDWGSGHVEEFRVNTLDSSNKVFAISNCGFRGQNHEHLELCGIQN